MFKLLDQYPLANVVGVVACVECLAELLGQSDDDALRASQEAEPVDILVLHDLANEFGAVAAEAGNVVVDVVDSEHDAAYAQRVRRRVFRLGSDRRRRVELRQLNPAVAVRSPHHDDVGTDAVKSDNAVYFLTLAEPFCAATFSGSHATPFPRSPHLAQCRPPQPTN